jgi:predicted nuclease of predicted toxin-antitoxin system
MISFVVDEGVDKQITDRLTDLGFEVFSIATMMSGVSDVKVLDLANSKNSILVTSDKDFGELVFRRMLINSGVILIRLAGIPISDKVEIVCSFICEHKKEISKAFSVITKNGVRVRKYQLISI